MSNLKTQWKALHRSERLILGIGGASLVVATVVGGAVKSAEQPTPVSHVTRSHVSAPVTSSPPTHTVHAKKHKHHKRHHKHHIHIIPTPVVTHAPVSTPTPTPEPVGCYPLSASGHCYDAGEFCPNADLGTSGIATNGEAIICKGPGSPGHWYVK